MRRLYQRVFSLVLICTLFLLGMASAATNETEALYSAISYLNVVSLSYQGLINQLKYDGYTAEEAIYAADNCGADWNEQALKSGRNHLALMPFSHDDLIARLISEGFTSRQATYAADNCQMDDALISAENYLSIMPFSYEGLID